MLLAHGGKGYNNLHLRFNFRDKQYLVQRNEGIFQYERRFELEQDSIRDVLDNSGFTRYVNGKMVMVKKEKAEAYHEALNSVVYFALLPYGLNDPAVNKRYIGHIQIHDVVYDKIEVSFDQKGGGKDFEDVFVYWVNRKTNTMDFLAYQFHVNGGGMRFRSAYNSREVNKIRFQDYVNYKPKANALAVHQLDSLYIKGELHELSRIELKNIAVTTP